MSALTRLADGVWTATAPMQFIGMPLTSTMSVLRLDDGGLMLHSPIAMTDALRAEVEALGPVAQLYAPNTFHHVSIGQWAAAFPDARLHAPAALAKKRPDLHIDRAHDMTREPAFAGVLDEIHIDGFRLEESALVHRPSRTLIVADLVHNIGTPPDGWTMIYASLMGFYGEVAISRMIRLAAFPDRRAARKSVDAVLEHELDRVIVGHGAPLTTDAREQLRAAYAWLR